MAPRGTELWHKCVLFFCVAQFEELELAISNTRTAISGMITFKEKVVFQVGLNAFPLTTGVTSFCLSEAHPRMRILTNGFGI
jgi:hypothetical protein